MVDRSYMLAQPDGPSALKRFVDQAVIPAAIDAAALVERGLDQLAGSVRRRPSAALGMTVVGCMLAGLLHQGRTRR